MGDALILAGFFLLCLLVQVGVYPHIDMTVGVRGKSIRVSNQVVISVLVGFFVLALGLAFSLTVDEGPSGLQQILIGLFTLSWLILLNHILRNVGTGVRLALSALLTSALVLLVFTYPHVLLQNVFMACALLWVGPVMFRRYRIRIRWFLLGLLILLIIDVVNIALVYSDETIMVTPGFLSGIIVFGNSLLGIGDILLGYLIVSASLRYHGTGTAFLLALLIAIPIVIREFITPLADVMLPYYAVMVPVTFAVYALRWWFARMPRRA